MNSNFNIKLFIILQITVKEIGTSGKGKSGYETTERAEGIIVGTIA